MVIYFAAIPFLEKFDINYVERAKLRVYHMTWPDNQIYVLFNYYPKIMRVFSDEYPFQESPNSIIMKGFANAYEMRASVASRSIFITDPRKLSLWKIQMPGNVISQWKIDGIPESMSISPADEVVVLVVCPRNLNRNRDDALRDYEVLYVYRAADVTLLRIVGISTEITGMRCFVVSPTGTFIFAYNNPSRSIFDLVSELSADGRNILRTFDLGSIKSITMKDWFALDLAAVEDGRIFVADQFRHRVFLLNPQLTDYQLLIDHSTIEPSSLCYIQNKRQLIVGEMNYKEPRVSILHLSPCAVTKRTYLEN